MYLNVPGRYILFVYTSHFGVKILGYLYVILEISCLLNLTVNTIYLDYTSEAATLTTKDETSETNVSLHL